ncbi:MAG: YSC84-related protein [Alphaproteobacteria bacterium]
MKSLVATIGLLAMLVMPFEAVRADTAKEIEAGVNASLEVFREQVPGGDQLLDASKAALVFPNLVEGAFIFGAEYGEGALVRGGSMDSYYSLYSASFGFQAGAQSKSLVLLFMEEEALKTLMDRKGWEIGADLEVAVIGEGVSGEVSSTTFDQPVVAVVFRQQGLLAGVSLSGAKITRLKR